MVEDLKSRKDLLISLGIIVLGILGSLYIHSSLTTSIDRAQRQLREEREKNDLLIELKTVDKRAGKEKGVLFAKDASEMLQLVSSLMNRDYITVLSLIPSSRKKKDVEKFFVKARIQIAYRELLIFLKDLESLDKLIVIDKIYIAKGKEYNNSKKLDVVLDIYTIKKP